MPSFRRKPIRLSRDIYQGYRAYSLTLAVAERQSHFRDSILVHTCLANLRIAAVDHFDIVAYCFMPDHLHLLVVARTDEADLVDFVKQFKQRTGYDFRRRYGRSLWQRSYFDHVLRRTEDLRVVARYILENPVRAGLVRDFRSYPFSGSFTHDLHALAV